MLIQGLTMVRSSGSALLLGRSVLLKNVPPQLSLKCLCLLSVNSLLEGPCIFDVNLNLALAKGSSQGVVTYSVVGEEVISRPRTRDSMSADGFCPVIFTEARLANWFNRIV